MAPAQTGRVAARLPLKMVGRVVVVLARREESVIRKKNVAGQGRLVAVVAVGQGYQKPAGVVLVAGIIKCVANGKSVAIPATPPPQRSIFQPMGVA